MKFKVKKSDLLSSYQMVKQVIPSKTTNPILKTLYMSVSGEKDKLELRGTNGITYISIIIPAQVEAVGRVCVDTSILDAIQNFAEGDISFEVNLEGKLSVTQNKKKHRPSYMDAIDYPEPFEIENYVEIKPKDFLKPFDKTSVTISGNVDRPILQGFLINPHSNLVMSGDGYSLTKYSTQVLEGNISVPPGRILLGFYSYISGLGETDKFYVSVGQKLGMKAEQFDGVGNWVRSWEVMINSLSGDYPETPGQVLDGFLKSAEVFSIVGPIASLQNILKTARFYSEKAYSEGKVDYVEMSINDDIILFTMKIPDMVEMEEELEGFDITGKPFTICFNPAKLQEILSKIEDEKIEIRFFEGEKSPLLVLDPSNKDWAYLQARVIKEEQK